MKKLLLCLLTMVGFVMSTEAQTVVVQKNETTTNQTQDPNIFYINGIPSTQDIGGVEGQSIRTEIYKQHIEQNVWTEVVQFTNYNPCTVTVLYQIVISEKDRQTGSIVLKAGEKKM